MMLATCHCEYLCVYVRLSLCVCVWSVAAECIQHAESVIVWMDSDESHSCLHGDVHYLLQESARSVFHNPIFTSNSKH